VPATSTLALLSAVVAAVVVVAAVRLASRGRDRVGLVALPLGLVALGVCAAVQVLACRAAGGSFGLFDALSFLYYDLVVAIPLAAAVLLVSQLARRPAGQRLSPGVAAVAGLSLLPAAVGAYATHIEPYDLRVERASAALPASRGGQPLEVGVLSDLQTTHIGGYQTGAIDRLMAEEPDVVLVAGDLFQGDEQQYADNEEALRAVLRQLATAPGGAFIVGGDTDDPTALAELVAGTGATYLHDEVVSTEVDDRQVAVGGLSLRATGATQPVLDGLASQPAATIRLLVAHRPEHVLDVHAGTVDLFAAGHTHGGQVQVPVIGPLMTMTSVPRHVAAGGLHQVAGTTTYVSTGVGREQQGAPQIRLLARPSVGVITLT
jgi:hypothetical protein